MRRILLWSAALAIMVASALFQSATGPTYPKSGRAEIAGRSLDYVLLRTHGGEEDQPAFVPFPGEGIEGRVEWRRHSVDEAWARAPMHFEPDFRVYLGRGKYAEGPMLVGYLPHQPPAGKLDYRIVLEAGDERVLVPSEGAVVTRFKGAVPAWFLAPHIILMFFGLLLSTRAGLESLSPAGQPRTMALWAFGLLFVGGMILGPVVQHYAFGAFWTGVPFGWDLTDNKTLIFVLAWAWAFWKGRDGRDNRVAIIVASAVTLAVYLIPHSVLGSELDYSTLEAEVMR
ncbi:hypothetical protein ACFL4Y_02025 [Gemmatimonadota bacterium]